MTISPLSARLMASTLALDTTGTWALGPAQWMAHARTLEEGTLWEEAADAWANVKFTSYHDRKLNRKARNNEARCLARAMQDIRYRAMQDMRYRDA